MLSIDGSIRIVKTGVACTINTGDVYSRASGGIYQFGTVGGKPRTTCTIVVPSIRHETTMYKKVWWGLQRVAGPFRSASYGEGTLQQTNVQVICQDYRQTTWRMIVRSTTAFPTGSVGSGSAYEDSTEACGTR
jgi:hypothetical protein